MIKSLSKTVTAGVLSLTLALTAVAPTSAQAQWSEEDTVGALLALLLLGAAVHHSRDRDDAPARSTDTRTQPRPDWRVLPANCVRRINTRDGERVRMFTQRCLNNNYSFVNRLPERCRIRVRNDNNQVRQGFRPRCLQNAGFRTNQH